MMELQFLQAALVLGGFIVLAGCYGVLYGMGRLMHVRAIMIAGFVCYGLQCLTAAFVIAATPLDNAWKAVIVICTIGFLGIPPVTCFFLERTHDHEEA
jgi:hypothetical protein